MKAEQMLVLASARGLRLDLRRPRRDIPYAHRSPPPRRDVRAATEDDPGDRGIPGVLTAEGRQTRASRAPEWTPVDLGFAAAGMADRPWRALCWAIALEEQARAYLKAELLMLAAEAKERDGWPATLRRGVCHNQLAPGVRCGAVRCNHASYLDDLCELVLVELAEPHLFKADTERARQFGVQEHTWKRQVDRAYAWLKMHADSWYSSAIGHLNRRLEERDLERESA